MFVKLTKGYKSQLIEFIKKHHQPEKGIFIDYDLLEGIFKKINRDDYENDELICYLHLENNIIDAIAFLTGGTVFDCDFCLTFYSINYNATEDILNMPILKNKKVYITARSPYIYQHLLTYLGNIPHNAENMLYYQYARHTAVNENAGNYIIKEIDKSVSSEEVSYTHGIFVGDIGVSRCTISLCSSETIPELAYIPKLWGMFALHTHEEYRRQGYARILTLFSANKILELGGIPFCFINSDNIASQCNAQKCGFIPIYRGINFTIIL